MILPDCQSDTKNFNMAELPHRPMDSDKLQEIGEKLNVSNEDVKDLRGKAREEKRRRWIQRKILAFWSLISAFIGLSLSFAYQEAENTAYPFSYDRPGGNAMPIIAFSSSAAAIGLLASFRNRKRQTLPQKEMNQSIFQTIFASIVMFAMAFFWAENSIFSGGLLYSVFSRDGDPER